jgi:hypothetical protein
MRLGPVPDKQHEKGKFDERCIRATTWDNSSHKPIGNAVVDEKGNAQGN